MDLIRIFHQFLYQTDILLIMDLTEWQPLSILIKKFFCTNTTNPISAYNYKYFKDRGLDDQILEFGVLKYIELKSKVFLALIWPSANKEINYFNSF